MSDVPPSPARRSALKCLAYGSAGTLFTLTGGVLTPLDLALAGSERAAGRALFVQISDTHIGFDKPANPDVDGTLVRTIAQVNALPAAPALILHTGDITHGATPAQFDHARQLLGGFHTTELHTVPGEHDVIDGATVAYDERFGAAGGARGYYSFDHAGVHFIALVNVLSFKPGAFGQLGEEQVAWVLADLKARSSSTPIVVFAHMPLWTVYEPWGWGTADVAPIMLALKRFGSVTVLNGHIHQIVQRVEGQMLLHTARSTAYPQPAPGTAANPGPLQVPSEQLPSMIGLTRVAQARHHTLLLQDETLQGADA